MRKCMVAAAIAACMMMVSAVDAGQPRWLEGKITYVRDIDTFEVNGIPIRLDGVDGPEYKERDGRAAKRWLQNTYGGAKVRCWLDGTTTYDRHVGICYDRMEQDIGAVIIANGWARDCPRYSDGRYQVYEPGYPI